MSQRLCAITFEARLAEPTGRMLLHVAVVLHQLQINPSGLTWTEPQEKPGFRVWLLTVPASGKVPELVAALESSIGVTRVDARTIPPDGAT